MYINAKFLLFLFLLAVVQALGSPYWVAHQMRVAADSDDGVALAAYVDFPSLRQSLKDQMKAAVAAEMERDMEDNPFAALGAMFSGVMVDSTVDAFVTPDGVIAMLKGADPSEDRPKRQNDNTTPALDDAELGYQRWDKFQIRLHDNDGETLIFNLRRRGISWKLTDVVLPLGDAQQVQAGLHQLS